MRPIALRQHTQPDGSVYHETDSGCPLGTCVVVSPAAEVPETCCHLHCGGVDDQERLQWRCSKVPCRRGA